MAVLNSVFTWIVLSSLEAGYKKRSDILTNMSSCEAESGGIPNWREVREMHFQSSARPKKLP